MKTIILGREGNQPFPIKEDAHGVSRRHAQITIRDDGEWFLEDLGSSNGTFIRNNKTGDFMPVHERQRIFPMTFVLLGPDNSNGCCFFAKQAEHYGDFTEERQYLMAKDNEFSELIEKTEQANKKLTLIKTILPFALFGLSIVLIPGEGTLQMLIRMAAAAVPSAAIQIFYDASTKKKEIKEQMQKFSHCPNPCCSNKQSSKEIQNMMCSKCKK